MAKSFTRWPRFDGAGKDAHVGDHAAVGVVERIEDRAAQQLVRIFLRGGDAGDDGFEDFLDADAFLALAGMQSSAGMQRMSSSCFLHFGTSAAGRSILLRTGMMVRFCSIARCTLATVWASTPWAASTIRIAPSQAARVRETS